MSNNGNTEVEVIKLRIESLKANRIFFTVLFTIETAILGIVIKRFSSLSLEFIPSAAFLSSSIVLSLLGIFSLTDSIHFNSKYLEYKYAWHDKVHGIAYEHKTREEKAINDFKRALEADDVGYYLLKLSLLSFLYFLTFLILIVQRLEIEERIFLSFLFSLLVTYISVRTYKATHRKRWFEALVDFFRRKPVFEKFK